MRLLALAAALLLALVAPATAARPGPTPVPTAPAVLLTTTVGEGTLPGATWRKLVLESLRARTVATDDGTTLADDARCRSAHATYAVLATFDRAVRLPGLALDTDRAYAVARFTVRNCVTGVVAPTKTLRVESEPLAEAARGERDAAVAAAMWQRAAQVSLARDPLVLAPPVAPAATGASGAPSASGAHVARIASIVDGIVYLDRGDGFAVNQVLRDYADRNAHPHAPVQLVVVEVTRRYVAATVIGNGTPHVGDYVDATPVK